MLKLALLFFLMSIVFGLFGFTTLAGVSATIAKALFVIFMVIFILLLVFAWAVV